MAQPTRGLLNPEQSVAQLSLTVHTPAPELADCVACHFCASWDLSAPRVQELLPCPTVYLVLGTHRAGVHGPVSTRFVTALEGEGWSFGTALLPGMLRVFAPHCKPRDIVDQTRPLTWIFGQDARALEQAVERATSAKERIELLGRFLRTRRDDSELDTCLLAARIVDEAKHRPALTRVVELAERAGLSVRALERLFREYVGMTPKAVIQRYRIQEAAQRAATGAAVDWVNLAQACGYADQAHFIRDFKAQIGQTPARYASNQALS